MAEAAVFAKRAAEVAEQCPSIRAALAEAADAPEIAALAEEIVSIDQSRVG